MSAQLRLENVVGIPRAMGAVIEAVAAVEWAMSSVKMEGSMATVALQLETRLRLAATSDRSGRRWCVAHKLQLLAVMCGPSPDAPHAPLPRPDGDVGPTLDRLLGVAVMNPQTYRLTHLQARVQ